MEEIFAYRKLVVYQHSRKYVTYVYKLISKFPSEERYALCDQLRRAVISIPSNIAEGMGRISDKDKLHFLEFAYGSLYETISQFELALDLNYITQDEFNEIENQVVDIAKMLFGLRNSIARRL